MVKLPAIDTHMNEQEFKINNYNPIVPYIIHNFPEKNQSNIEKMRVEK